MRELSLHILDIAENSIRAGAKNVAITITEDPAQDLLCIEVDDDGCGMSEEDQRLALDPFYTTKTVRRVGLGLPLLAQAAQRAGGTFRLLSTKGKGTRVTATFGLSHIDRQPLGDMVGTMVSLIAGNPEADFVYTHAYGGRHFTLDTREIRANIDEVPINHPDILHFIREHIEEGLKEIGSAA